MKLKSSVVWILLVLLILATLGMDASSSAAVINEIPAPVSAALTKAAVLGKLSLIDFYAD